MRLIDEINFVCKLESGEPWGFTHAPELVGEQWLVTNGQGFCLNSVYFPELERCCWDESLHIVRCIDRDTVLEPYSQLELNTPLLVWNARFTGSKLRRRFKEMSSSGKVICFTDGRDSFTGKGHGSCTWDSYEVYKE